MTRSAGLLIAGGLFMIAAVHLLGLGMSVRGEDSRIVAAIGMSLNGALSIVLVVWGMATAYREGKKKE